MLGFVDVKCKGCGIEKEIPQGRGFTIYTTWQCDCGVSQDVYDGEPCLKVGDTVLRQMKKEDLEINIKRK
jgi:hypothetical protein